MTTAIPMALVVIVIAAVGLRHIAGRPLSRDEGNTFLVAVATLLLCSVISIVADSVSRPRADMLQSNANSGNCEQDSRKDLHTVRYVPLRLWMIEQPAQGLGGGEKAHSEFSANAGGFPDLGPTFGMLECKKAHAAEHGQRDRNENSELVHSRTPVDSTGNVTAPTSQGES